MSVATVAGFTFAATCQHCGHRLVANDTSSPTPRSRQAALACPNCDRRWTVTVTMTPADGPRLPWEPLAEHLPRSAVDAAEILHISGNTLRSWRAEGVPVEHADRAAIAAGLLPVHIWAGEYYAACDPHEAVA